jgi:diketogulonate reductase-like aldo/keto reductase
MKRKELLVLVFLGMVFLLLFSCGTSNKAVVSPATNDGTSFDFENRMVTLNNGIKMPILGLGTYLLTPAQAEESVYHALLDGYRLIDTANAYMNERAVGRGIQKAGIPRKEIFVTTKLWPSDYEDVERAIDDTLARLNLEYIDLLLLHQPYGNIVEGYRGMEAAVHQGKVRAIGLSNFFESRFDEIMRIATIPPAVLQIESNPYVQQTVMRAHVKPYGTVLNAWFPLGGRVDERNNTQTRLFNEGTIVEIAATYNKTPAQVILRWHLQIGNIAIPGSRNPDHILENISIFDFELTDAQMQRLIALDTGTPSFDFSNAGEQADFASFGPPMDFNDQE